MNIQSVFELNSFHLTKVDLIFSLTVLQIPMGTTDYCSRAANGIPVKRPIRENVRWSRATITRVSAVDDEWEGRRAVGKSAAISTDFLWRDDGADSDAWARARGARRRYVTRDGDGKTTSRLRGRWRWRRVASVCETRNRSRAEPWALWRTCGNACRKSDPQHRTTTATATLDVGSESRAAQSTARPGKALTNTRRRRQRPAELHFSIFRRWQTQFSDV